MFKSIETTEVVFTKRPKVKTKRADVARRPATPRPTDEEVLSILTGQLEVMPAIKEEDTVKKAKPSVA